MYSIITFHKKLNLIERVNEKFLRHMSNKFEQQGAISLIQLSKATVKSEISDRPKRVFMAETEFWLPF